LNNISCIDGLGMASSVQVAEYFGITKAALQKARTKIKSELDDLGVSTLPCKQVIARCKQYKKIDPVTYEVFLENGESIIIASTLTYYTIKGIERVRKELVSLGIIGRDSDAVSDDVNSDLLWKRNDDNKVTDLKIFNYEERKIRILMQDGEPWWVLSDVCKVLNIERVDSAARRLDPDEKGTHLVSTLGGNQKMTIINESGLYDVLLRSDKPEAKPFKRWITHEVLPSIRKHGGYIAGQEQMSGEELMARALLFAQSKISDLESKNRQLADKIESDKVKVEFAQTVGSCKDTMAVGVYAKLLYDQHRINMGRNQLFCYLRDKKILDKSNIPYQKYIDAGWFKVVNKPNPEIKRNIPVTRITAKGQQKLYELIAKDFNR